MAKTKRPRTVQGKNVATFQSSQQLVDALKSRNPEALKNTLVSFRNQITVGHDERPSVGDARVLLVTSWLENSSGASELFDIWDSGSNYTSLVLVSLAHTLSLVSGTPAGSTYAPGILRVLFDGTHTRRLNAHLASGQTDVVLAALKVLGAAAAIDQRSTFDAIAWTAKSLPKLLSHRHRTPTSQPLNHPSIRTALTTLVLALLPLTLPLDIFTALFRGLAQDDGVLVKLVLEACWEKIWCDVKVPKSLKVKVFGGLGIYIQPLYERTDSDSTDPLAPADVVHHFFLALCTKPGVGLCFRSKGWYPRPSGNPFDDHDTADNGVGEHQGDDDGESSGKGTLYNPLLLKLLRTLRPAVDARQHELAARILNACPDLVGAYFGKGAAQIGLSLEPRLSTRWITSVGFVAAVVKTDVPIDSFHLDPPAHSLASSSPVPIREYRANPPPLAAIVENIVPSVLTRAWLTKGLLTRPTASGAQAEQGSSASSASGTLVQHTTIRLLSQCLLKLSDVLAAFPSGWAERAAEVVDAVRKKVPELGVVVSLAQEATKALKEDGEDKTQTTDEGGKARGLLLAEGALRLLWLYARVLPGTMAETRFDVGKLLQETEVDEDTSEGATDGMRGLRVMCQIHMLRLLGESDQFVWSAKPSSSSHTHMYRLLALHLRTPHLHLRAASAALIVRLFGSSVLFEHDPREANAWIEALPRNKYPASSNSEDDITIFLAFFDDVLSRCVKTPYKYLELGIQLYAVFSSNVSCMPSPLLMAVLEQLRHKPMDSSARQLVAAFVARLIRLVVGKMDIAGAKAVVGYMRNVFTKDGEKSPGMKVVSGLDAFLEDLESPDEGMDVDVDSTSTPAAIEFVKEAEAIVVKDDKVASMRAASKVLDWVRGSNEVLGSSEVVKLLRLLVSWSTDGVALGEFLEDLELGRRPTLILSLADDVNLRSSVLNVISSPAAFWILSSYGSGVASTQEAFARSLAKQPSELLVWSCGLVAHHLDAGIRLSSKSVVQNCLGALKIISQHGAGVREVDEIKQALFGDLPAVKTLLMDSTWSAHLAGIVSTLLSEDNEGDQGLAAPYSQHWSRCLLEAPSDREFEESAAGFTIWIPFTPGSTCVQLFKASLERVRDWSSLSPTVKSLLESLASHLRATALDKPDVQQLAKTLPKLIKVPALSQYRNLLKLAPTIAERELPLGLDLAYIDPNESLLNTTRKAIGRWVSRSEVLNLISWAGFSGWVDTEELARLSTALMYLSASARADFSAWIGQQSSLSSRSIGPCFALMDCYTALIQNDAGQPRLPKVTVDKIHECAVRLLFKHGESDEHQRWAVHILVRMMQAFPDDIGQVAQIVVARFPSNHRDVFHQLALSFFAHSILKQSHWDDVIDLVVDSGLLWLVRRFAEDDVDSPELQACLPIFASLLPRASNIKPHLAEPVLIAAIKNRLQSSCVISLCSSIVVHTSLKPININKLLQSVIHHPSFSSICRTPSPVKDAVIGLLHSIFHKHPSSTCHPSHIIPLLHVYRGSLDRSDAQILSIFHLFEKSRQVSTLDILRNWTPELSLAQPKDLLETVCNFDSVTMFRTCTSFPQRRDLQVIDPGPEDNRADIYDPNFVLPLLAALMVSDEPIANVQWVDLCRTNVLSLAVVSLSSKRPSTRQLSYASLVTAYTRLLDVDFQEQAQLIYTLDLLRNLVPQSASTPSQSIPRLPTYATLLLSHALRDIFTPATPLYPLISRFLLQRPEFDSKDVPLLYTLLYSSSGEWKRERGWMLRFLVDGMRSTEDWRVLKRRHTWDLLASLFQSAVDDRTLRLSILEVLVNASANKHAATSLLLGSSILSWIYMQLNHILPGEDLAYLRILENMVVVVDHEQIEKATIGHWRDTIAEIIGKIVQTSESNSSLLCLAAQVLLRLAITLGNTPISFLGPIKLILDALSRHDLSLKDPLVNGSHPALNSGALHTSRSLLQPVAGTPWEHWRSTVYALWRLSLDTEPNSPHIWANLTSRILFANSMMGAGFGEFAWIREETVTSLMVLALK